MTDKRDYAQMTTEELEQRLRETFFWPDKIDGTVYRELEAIRAELEKREPTVCLITPEEGWTRFLEDRKEELEALWGRPGKPERRRTPLRALLIAAAVVVLLAGTALAAGPQLWTWVRGWSGIPERYAPTGSGAAGPILEALEDLGITEPVYPAWLPQNYVLAEAHISEDPLLLYELYTRSDRYISITVMPISAASSAIRMQEDRLPREYRAVDAPHYLFSNDGSITIVWYTENYFTSIRSNITAGAMNRIANSVNTNKGDPR